MMEPLTNALSVDVEDWNNGAVLLVSGQVLPPTGDVVTNTERLFALMTSRGVRATWFFLGNVAEKYPHLVRMVVDAGHEVGVHGYHHHQIHTLDPATYRQSIIDAKDMVEQAGGARVRGYRAVAASVSRETWYVFDVLVEAGFVYDSSIFPFKGPRYGIGDAPVDPHWVTAPHGGRIFEVPLSVVDLGPLRLPCCGGGYLRHFPLWYTELALSWLGLRRRSAAFYLHPYEMEPESSLKLVPDSLSPEEKDALRGLTWSQFRGRTQTEHKLTSLFRRHRFAPFEEVYDIDAREAAQAR